MNKDKTFVLDAMRAYGLSAARALQAEAPNLTGTELNARSDHIPDFQAAKAKLNMLDRPAGFVCRSTAGQVVVLLQPYDSDIYAQEPEELSAQWGFKWSTDPAKALPYISLATSPYNKGECCEDDGKVWRSIINNNTLRPTEYPEAWKEE